MPEIVPLRAIPAQRLTITLGGQKCGMLIYAREIFVQLHDEEFAKVSPIFLDLYVDDALVLGGARCLTGVRIVRNFYLGFAGDLAFHDTFRAAADPEVAGLGTRWQLVYWTPEELA